tara:strand:- start:101 stop:550 length:450 start_codon:yes stop_codon:yes gene_type:complete
MKIFTNKDSAVRTVRNTLEVESTDEGGVNVTFNTSRGRTSAPVSIPAEHYTSFVTALRFYAENGMNMPVAEKTPAEIVRETIGLEDGVVSFRTKDGRGARPTRITEGELAGVVTLLLEVEGQVLAAADAVRVKIEEAKNIELAKTAEQD